MIIAFSITKKILMFINSEDVDVIKTQFLKISVHQKYFLNILLFCLDRYFFNFHLKKVEEYYRINEKNCK